MLDWTKDKNAVFQDWNVQAWGAVKAAMIDKGITYIEKDEKFGDFNCPQHHPNFTAWQIEVLERMGDLKESTKRDAGLLNEAAYRIAADIVKVIT